MPGTHQIPSGVLAGADQIPGGFFLDRLDMHDRDLAQLKLACQMERVPGVFTRSPEGRSSFEEAATTHSMAEPVNRRNKPNPVGPAS